jgi:hypothetical protein
VKVGAEETTESTKRIRSSCTIRVQFEYNSSTIRVQFEYNSTWNSVLSVTEKFGIQLCNLGDKLNYLETGGLQTVHGTV